MIKILCGKHKQMSKMSLIWYRFQCFMWTMQRFTKSQMTNSLGNFLLGSKKTSSQNYLFFDRFEPQKSHKFVWKMSKTRCKSILLVINSWCWCIEVGSSHLLSRISIRKPANNFEFKSAQSTIKSLATPHKIAFGIRCLQNDTKSTCLISKPMLLVCTLFSGGWIYACVRVYLLLKNRFFVVHKSPARCDLVIAKQFQFGTSH